MAVRLFGSLMQNIISPPASSSKSSAALFDELIALRI